MSRFFLLIIIIFSSCRNDNTSILTIAVATNAQYVTEQLINAYQKQTGIKSLMIVGSSGKLTAQIIEGAPYDLFMSADMSYPKTLYEADMTTDAPQVYAIGQIVLWSSKLQLIDTIDLLISEHIEHIAIPNPVVAPYGRAAMEVLDFYDITSVVKHKLVYGESVSQTAQFVSTGAAGIGFISKSMIVNTPLSKLGKWKSIDTTAYQPIEQGAVIIKRGSIKEHAAQNFYTFLFTKRAKEILRDGGYGILQ